jgi:hypothetical protein
MGLKCDTISVEHQKRLSRCFRADCNSDFMVPLLRFLLIRFARAYFSHLRRVSLSGVCRREKRLCLLSQFYSFGTVAVKQWRSFGDALFFYQPLNWLEFFNNFALALKCALKTSETEYFGESEREIGSGGWIWEKDRVSSFCFLYVASRNHYFVNSSGYSAADSDVSF